MKTSSRARLPTRTGLPPTPESWLPNEHNLYRPRHSPRQRTALTCALAFFLVPTLAFVLGARSVPFENRPLHEFPSLADGWGFFTGLSGWATDHLALRQAGVGAAEGISTGLFGDPPGAGRGAPSGPIGLGSGGTPAPGSEGAQPPGGYPPVISGGDGWLYLGTDVSNKCKPLMDLDHVIGELRRLRAAVESSGRRFELVVAPDKSTVVPEHLPQNYAGKDCSRARSAAFWSRVTREVGAIDLRGELAATAVRLGHPLYDANDTHWTYEGGVAMTYALAGRLVPGVTSSWAVTPQRTQPWPADIPPLLGRSEQRQLRTYGLAPDGTTDRTRYLASDFRTPLRLAQASTGPPARSAVGQRVGLIADSFTQFASPFLAAGFTDLVIVHAETMAQNPAAGADDLLLDRDVITVELAERNVAGGASPLLRDSVIDSIASALARNPR